jgi:hypothetical protein
LGQGQIVVSGTLARTNTFGGATVFPAEISIPDEMNRESLRLLNMWFAVSSSELARAKAPRNSLTYAAAA